MTNTSATSRAFNLTEWLTALWTAIRRYIWFPLAVFMINLIFAVGLKLYETWPPIDMPLHFFGGVAIAFFIAGTLRTLMQAELLEHARGLLFLILIISLTSVAAVVWEFGEWSIDYVLGTAFQAGLNDTLLDLFLGLAGGTAYIGCEAVRNPTRLQA